MNDEPTWIALVNNKVVEVADTQETLEEHLTDEGVKEATLYAVYANEVSSFRSNPIYFKRD